MFKKLDREKVFRDPLYGYIRVQYQLILDLIDTKELQRLRRIRQLSGVSMVFHTAEHSRFQHSLGAYEMARKVINEVYGAKNNMSEYEQILFMVSALLHDVGHGPYSHAFEQVISTSHEQMGANIIISPKTEINKVLSNYANLSKDVYDVLTHSGKFKLIESLISSQIDVDRMDYLQRDAYFTGATYGFIDYNRLLRSMEIIDGSVYFRPSGVHSIESYIMSRYHMYWQVYFHPTGKAYELLLESIYKRIKNLVDQNVYIDAHIESLIDVIKDNNDIESYLDLDDSYINGMIKQLIDSSDKILNVLANNFQNRKLFKYIDMNESTSVETVPELKSKYKNTKDGKYFYYESTFSQTAYLHVDQSVKYNPNQINIMLETGDVISLEEYSPIIKGLIRTSPKKSLRIFFLERN